MRNHRYLWALAAALFASCADYSVPDSVLYGTAVYTQPAPGFNPAGKSLTYYLNPTYREVDGETKTDIPLDTVPTVRDAIIQQMENVYGYTPVAAPPPLTKPDADVVMNMTVLKGNVDVYYPGYWCDYWYYYSCYYGGAYYGGSYDVGMLVLELGDLSSTSSTLPILWSGLVYGVVTNTWNDQTRAVDGINRAFGQSTYLKTN